MGQIAKQPNGLKISFRIRAPPILTQVTGLTSSANGKYLITITKQEGYAAVNVSVKMGKAPKIKQEWKITKTTYSITGSGASFGTGGFPTTGEKKTPDFILIFDYKYEFLGKTKETTLFSQIRLYAIKDGSQKTVSDFGVSGKDTDPTISATYKKGN